MRLIDADKTISHIKSRMMETALNNALVVCDVSYIYQDCAYNRIETWINEMPTVDTAPVRHGRWIDHQYKEYPIGRYECSACGAKHDMEWYYCPNCGAKMDAEDEDGAV